MVAAKELRGTARKAMEVVHRRAVAGVPVGNIPHKTYKGNRVFGGFAKRSIRLVAFVDKKNGTAVALVGPRREAFYATQFIELGTSKMPARPWLRPALQGSQNAVLTEIKQHLTRRVRRLSR